MSSRKRGAGPTRKSVRLLEVGIVAVRMSLSQETVRRYIRSGRLRAVRLHTGQLRVPQAAFDEYYASLERLELRKDGQA